MVKKTATALTLAICLSSQAIALNFTDVPSSHWAYSYIQEASENGWVTGKGNNIYDPEGKVTTAEFYTLLARAFYGSEIPSTAQTGQWYSDKWYGPYFEVGLKHSFDRLYGNKIDTVTEAEMNLARSGMASLISGVLEDKGITISDSVYNTTKAKIPDINKVMTNYQKGVVTVYALGIITGVDDAGNFDPSGLMTRAQVATVLCRLDDVIKNGGSISTPDNGNEEDNNTGTTDQGTNTGANYGPVGTLSDFMVTLSYETHKPVTDYWSKTDPAIQAVTDKDAYNAAVQTLKDESFCRTEDIVSRNPYYNYAVYSESDFNSKVKLTVQAAIDIMGRSQCVDDPRATDFVFTLGDVRNSSGYSVYKDTLDSITPDMTDKEVVIKCMRKVTDTFTYGNYNGGWETERKEGLCGELSMATAQILNAAGIPTFTVTVPNHMYCYSLIDGEWWAVDPTLAEQGSQIGDYAAAVWMKDPDEKWVIYNHDGSRADINTPGTRSSITRSMIEQAGYAPRHKS